MLALIGAVWLLLWRFTGSGCLFRAITGLPCPGCGSTRAAAALLSGDISGMLAWHPLLPITIVLLVIGAYGELLRKGNVYTSKLRLYMLFGLLAAYILLYVVRLILYFPHTAPMTILHSSLLQRAIHIIKDFLS